MGMVVAMLQLDVATDCHLCFGTGVLYPTHEGTFSCPNCGEQGQQWGGVHHRQVLARQTGYVAWVDMGMVETVETLWLAGIRTAVSCAGGPWVTRADRYDEPYLAVLLPHLRGQTGELINRCGWHIIQIDRPARQDADVYRLTRALRRLDED